MQHVFQAVGEIDFELLRQSLYTVGSDARVTRAFYYDCIDDIQKPSESSAQFGVRVELQNKFLKGIQSLDGFFVRLGTVQGRRIRPLFSEVNHEPEQDSLSSSPAGVGKGRGPHSAQRTHHSKSG